MRKVVFLIIALISINASASSVAAVKIVPGTKCPKAGQSSIYNGKKYTCLKLGRNLFWNNGIKIKNDSPQVIKNLDTCNIENQVIKSSGKEFICLKLGSKLFWYDTIYSDKRNEEATPSPQPSPSPSLSPTPNPSPSPLPIKLERVTDIQSQSLQGELSGTKWKFGITVRWNIGPDSNRIGFRLKIEGGGILVEPPCNLALSACQPSYYKDKDIFSIDILDPKLEVYTFQNLNYGASQYFISIAPLGSNIIGEASTRFATTLGTAIPGDPDFNVNVSGTSVVLNWQGKFLSNYFTKGAIYKIEFLGLEGCTPNTASINTSGSVTLVCQPGTHIISGKVFDQTGASGFSSMKTITVSG